MKLWKTTIPKQRYCRFLLSWSLGDNSSEEHHGQGGQFGVDRLYSSASRPLSDALVQNLNRSWSHVYLSAGCCGSGQTRWLTVKCDNTEQFRTHVSYHDQTTNERFRWRPTHSTDVIGNSILQLRANIIKETRCMIDFNSVFLERVPKTCTNASWNLMYKTELLTWEQFKGRGHIIFLFRMGQLVVFKRRAVLRQCAALKSLY